MKISTPETPKPRSKLSILLIGPPGGGKTSLALQFPNVYVLDCDMNLDGPERWVRTVNPNLKYFYDSVRLDDEGKEIPLELCADRMFTLLQKASLDPVIQTIFIDGMTYLNEMLIAKTMDVQSRIDEMMRQDWIPFRRYMLKVLMHLRTVAKTTIVSCHEDILMMDSKSGPVVTKYRPSLSSKIRDYFGGLFTDIWRCTASQPVGGRPQPFKIQVVSSGLSDCKNSVGFPNADMNATWEELNKYLKL